MAGCLIGKGRYITLKLLHLHTPLRGEQLGAAAHYLAELDEGWTEGLKHEPHFDGRAQHADGVAFPVQDVFHIEANTREGRALYCEVLHVAAEDVEDLAEAKALGDPVATPTRKKAHPPPVELTLCVVGDHRGVEAKKGLQQDHQSRHDEAGDAEPEDGGSLYHEGVD